MKQFTYLIQKEFAMHFGPAGRLAEIARVYPDILTDTEKFPSELSCAERSVSAPQTIAANVFASTAVASMLYYLLIEGSLENTRVAFSSRKLSLRKVA